MLCVSDSFVLFQSKLLAHIHDLYIRFAISARRSVLHQLVDLPQDGMGWDGI